MSEWPLIPAGIAVLAGCGLVFLGLSAPRRGDGRFCRRCRYNLAGLTSQRCPECGSDLAARGAVQVGLRSIRLKPLAAGFVLLVFGAPLLLGVAGKAVWEFNWWRLAPSELLLRSASSGSVGARREAVVRLKTPATDPVTAAGILEAGTTVSLSVRKRLVCGEFHPARIRTNFWGEMLAGGVWTNVEVVALRIDGEPRRVDANSHVSRGTTVIIEEPGAHTLEMDLRVYTVLELAGPQIAFQCTLRETVTAVAAGEVDDVELVRSAQLDESLTDGIRIEGLNLAAVHEDGWWPAARLRISAPIDLALRVEAEHDGKRVWIGDVAFQSAQPRVARWVRAAPRSDVMKAFVQLPKQCDLIFRGDKRAARATTDLSRIWGGETRVRDVPLRDSRGRRN